MQKQEQPSKAAPLLCWDIYMDFYNRRIQLFEDLQEVNSFARRKGWRKEGWSLQTKLLEEGKVILITDLSQIIQYTSSNLVFMNGYRREEVIGKSPRMFQGAASCVCTRQQIREAIQKRVPFHGTLVNYRKDGTPYDCLVEEYPVWNTEGLLVNYIAFEKVA